MGRYEIAKAVFKNPEELKLLPKKSSIKYFGFDDPLAFGTEYLRKAKTYYCPAGTKKKVGIVFKDPAHLFVGGKVHWFGRQYFLCKRGTDSTCICCEATAPHPATWRMACIIVVYNSEDDYSVLPWVFGRRVYEGLDNLNKIAPLQFNDFTLEKGSEQDHYNPWKVYSSHGSSSSLWQTYHREDVLRLAEPHFMNLKSCIGVNLSISQIQELINRNLVPRRSRDRTQRNVLPTRELESMRPTSRTTNLAFIYDENGNSV
jgi:hypothetical protein